MEGDEFTLPDLEICHKIRILMIFLFKYRFKSSLKTYHWANSSSALLILYFLLKRDAQRESGGRKISHFDSSVAPQHGNL